LITKPPPKYILPNNFKIINLKILLIHPILLS